MDIETLVVVVAVVGLGAQASLSAWPQHRRLHGYVASVCYPLAMVIAAARMVWPANQLIALVLIALALVIFVLLFRETSEIGNLFADLPTESLRKLEDFQRDFESGPESGTSARGRLRYMQGAIEALIADNRIDEAIILCDQMVRIASGISPRISGEAKAFVRGLKPPEPRKRRIWGRGR